jgi:hypothetical protein
MALLRAEPALAEAFMTRLAHQLQELRTRMELRNIRSARERLLQYLRLRAGSVRIEGQLQDIAAEIGAVNRRGGSRFRGMFHRGDSHLFSALNVNQFAEPCNFTSGIRLLWGSIETGSRASRCCGSRKGKVFESIRNPGYATPILSLPGGGSQQEDSKSRS